MRERFAVEEDFAFDQFRKGIVGMFVSVTGERRERLDLGDGVEPARNLRARMLAPSFDRQRELRGDEQHKGYRREELVPQRIENLDQAAEPRDLTRRRFSIRSKFAPEPRQQRRRESLLLQPPQDLGQQRQFAPGPLDLRNHPSDLRAVEKKKA